MIKKMEMKVNIHCQRCITAVFKSVTKLIGIDEISVDSEKGIVTVIGEADPVCVANQIKKTGKTVEFVSVGPPKEPEKPKPPEDKCPEVIYPWLWSWSCPSYPPPCSF